MKEKSVPDAAKMRAALRRAHTALHILMLICAFLAVGSLIALAVVVIMLGFGQRSAEQVRLLYILAGSFLGGALLFAFAAAGLSRLTQTAALREKDFRERCDSEESFFVGEGTLATFSDGELLIHAEGDEKREKIRVPYEKIRFFSVCTRTRPREKGEWSVVIEIPAVYLAKKGKAQKDAPPALVQTDGKERLYKCLARRALPLIGALPPEEKGEKEKKFTAVKRFRLPNIKKRKRAAILSAVGGAVIIAGALVAFLYEVTLGAALAAVGAVVTGRAVWAFIRASAIFALYREGIYYCDSSRTQCTFLKWEDVERVIFARQGDKPLLVARCAYGDYSFPAVAGAREALEESFPEKCGGKEE